MKTIAVIILIITLYLMYRTACPKQTGKKKDDAAPQKEEFDISDVVIKSRFVRPERRQVEPTPATPLKTDLEAEKPSIFATGNEQRSAVVSPEKMEEVFSEDEPDPKDLDIRLDENEETDESEDLEDETEDLQQSLGKDAELAVGLSIEELTEAAEAVDKPSDEKGAILYRVEKTDMFEQLVSGDEGKLEWIKAIIDRHVRNLYPEVENEFSDNDEWKNFDVQSFLDTGIYD